MQDTQGRGESHRALCADGFGIPHTCISIDTRGSGPCVCFSYFGSRHSSKLVWVLESEPRVKFESIRGACFTRGHGHGCGPPYPRMHSRRGTAERSGFWIMPVYGGACEWLSKLWSLFGVRIIIRHLIFRVPKKGSNNF